MRKIRNLILFLLLSTCAQPLGVAAHADEAGHEAN